MLGVYSPEEFPTDSFAGPTIEHTAPEPAAAPVARAEPPKQPAKPTVAGWLDALALELAAAADMDAVDEILARPEVQQAQDRLRNGARDRLQHILDEAITRTARADDAAEAEDGDALFADPATDPFRELTPS